MEPRILLRELLTECGQPAYRLSEKAGLSRQYLGHLLRGERELQLKHLALLRPHLGGSDDAWRAIFVALVIKQGGDDFAKYVL